MKSWSSIWHLLSTNCQIDGEDLSFFVTFLENMNFKFWIKNCSTHPIKTQRMMVYEMKNIIISTTLKL